MFGGSQNLSLDGKLLSGRLLSSTKLMKGGFVLEREPS